MVFDFATFNSESFKSHLRIPTPQAIHSVQNLNDYFKIINTCIFISILIVCDEYILKNKLTTEIHTCCSLKDQKSTQK